MSKKMDTVRSDECPKPWVKVSDKPWVKVSDAVSMGKLPFKQPKLQ